MRKFLWIIALMTWVVPAWAGGTGIEFTGSSPGGQGVLAFKPGTGHDLVITGALISNIVNNLGVCGGDCAVTHGSMSLLSGGESSVANPVAGTYIYTFKAGGTIDIFGEIAGMTHPELLFSATFLNGGVFTVSGSTGVFSANINLASIYLNPALGKYTFSGGATDSISLSLNLACSTGGLCLGSINSAEADLGVTSEPSTLGLLGSGLAVFAGVIRRRKWLARS